MQCTLISRKNLLFHLVRPELFQQKLYNGKNTDVFRVFFDYNKDPDL